MHIDALKYFSYVVEEKSISKAAKKAHMSQSALSQQIQKLEEDFGYTLLHRSNRGVSLTELGEVVLKYSANIIDNYEKMIEELEGTALNRHSITIAGTPSLAAYSLPCVLYRCKKKFPREKYQLTTQAVEVILNGIRNDLFDYGFIDRQPQQTFACFYEKLGKEKIVLVAPMTYHLSQDLTLERLLTMELILCTMTERVHDLLAGYLRRLGKTLDDLNIVFRADNLSSVKSSVMNGYGMAFVPYEAVKHELYQKNLQIIEVDDLDLDYDIYIVSKPKNELARHVRESMDYLLELGTKSFC